MSYVELFERLRQPRHARTYDSRETKEIVEANASSYRRPTRLDDDDGRVAEGSVAHGSGEGGRDKRRRARLRDHARRVAPSTNAKQTPESSASHPAENACISEQRTTAKATKPLCEYTGLRPKTLRAPTATAPPPFSTQGPPPPRRAPPPTAPPPPPSPPATPRSHQ